VTFKEGLAQFSKVIPEAEQMILAHRLMEYADERTFFIQAYEQQQFSQLQKLLLALAPIMFAAALALRMTKVTADIRFEDDIDCG